jgi:hypothetical protein
MNNRDNRLQMRAFWAAELAYGTFDKSVLLPFAANYKTVKAPLIIDASVLVLT